MMAKISGLIHLLLHMPSRWAHW